MSDSSPTNQIGRLTGGCTNNGKFSTSGLALVFAWCLGKIDTDMLSSLRYDHYASIGVIIPASNIWCQVNES